MLWQEVENTHGQAQPQSKVEQTRTHLSCKVLQMCHRWRRFDPSVRQRERRRALILCWDAEAWGGGGRIIKARQRSAPVAMTMHHSESRIISRLNTYDRMPHL